MKIREILLLAGSFAAASQACALSLGDTQGHVQLGAPVDLVFQVAPDAGQTADSSCLSADIWMGDTALPGSQVRLSSEAKSVRVRTTTPVYEPLITIKLLAGCNGAIARTYTFFADPPQSMAASVEPIDLSKIQVSTLPAAAAIASARPAAVKKPRTPKRAVTAKAETNPSASAPAAAATAAASTTVDALTSAAPATSAAPPNATLADKPRLKMEPIEGLDTPVAATPESSADENTVQSSASLDANTQMLLAANAARMEDMEKQLQTLQTQLKSQRTEIASLHTQLVQAQNQDLPIWVHVMLGLLALALATIAWLLQRIKHERTNAQRTWADTVLAVDNTPHATTIDTAAQPTFAANQAVQSTEKSAVVNDSSPVAEGMVPELPAAAEDAQEGLIPDHQAHQWFADLGHVPPLAPVASVSSASHAFLGEVLTAQALFDVQEQAEFYASIGENDQAIAILQSHIAEHEASSPLAYIELLQLLYRLSRTDAFEQVREKFQTHFNVNVPNFLGFSRKGHDLWSSHPDVLGRIEALWPSDDVQVLLRSLIVRRPSTELAQSEVRFDLAAFDDLLMLYNVAQTTPASSRGNLPGRMRTAPTEVPLPEVFMEATKPSASVPTKHENDTPSVPTPLSLNEASLELLTTAPTQAPLAEPRLSSDSLFQANPHFTTNETLMDGLTLEWDTNTSTAQAPQPALSHMEDLSLDGELAAFMMDERDLPPAALNKK